MNITNNKVIIFIVILVILIILTECFTIAESYDLDNNLNNHTLITSYPINYNIFPLAKKCKFIEINLNENEYISIPKNWMHWVFTEPYNFSMNYFLFSFDKNNQTFNNLIKKNHIKIK